MTPSGTRPLSRGGAFVAGADDAHALAYNPAGLAAAPDGLRLDFVWPLYATRFERTLTPEGSTDSITFPSVEGAPFGLPSPTLAGVYDFGWLPGLKLGLGLMTQVPALQRWPRTVDGADDGPTDAPQRYSVLSFEGSGISNLTLGAGYPALPWLHVGASFHLYVGQFGAEVAVSGCDGVVCTQPENWEYDALVGVAAGPILAPGVGLGIRAFLPLGLRLGLAWESGYTLRSPAKVAVALPANEVFDGVTVSPEEPTGVVHLRLPMNLRVGVEGTWREETIRAELAFVWEPWSVHDVIALSPRDAAVAGLPVFGDYGVAEVELPRGFVDTWSLRLGGEALLWEGGHDLGHLTVRAGFSYEPSAVPSAYLSPMTVDLDTITGSLGASVTVGTGAGKVAFDLAYAYAHMVGVQVGDSEVRQLSLLRPPFSGATVIGNGRYDGRAHLFGLSATWAWGDGS